MTLALLVDGGAGMEPKASHSLSTCCTIALALCSWQVFTAFVFAKERLWRPACEREAVCEYD